MADYQHIVLNEVADITVVHFLDSRIIEDLAIQQLGAELFSLVEVEGRKKLVLNFSAVNFMSSSALSKLINLHKKVVAAGGSMKLCKISPDIREIFTITNLNRLFDIRKEEADAIAAF